MRRPCANAAMPIVLGPGPGRPADAGQLLAGIAGRGVGAGVRSSACAWASKRSASFSAARVVHAPALVHGKTSAIEHDGSGVFAGLPSPLTATRYHSLCVEALPEMLRVTAASDDGVVQGIAHRDLPIYGVQFHPESVLTPDGPQLAANFLAIARGRRRA